MITCPHSPFCLKSRVLQVMQGQANETLHEAMASAILRCSLAVRQFLLISSCTDQSDFGPSCGCPEPQDRIRVLLFRFETKQSILEHSLSNLRLLGSSRGPLGSCAMECWLKFTGRAEGAASRGLGKLAKASATHPWKRRRWIS